MVSRTHRPSATSLPPSPRDDESSRFRKYMITMGIRIACFILMVTVHPYGWYTWIFAIGAIFLPYVAVVIANVGQDAHERSAESPELALPSAPSEQAAAPDTAERVIRVSESTQIAPPPTDGDRPESPS